MRAKSKKMPPAAKAVVSAVCFWAVLVTGIVAIGPSPAPAKQNDLTPTVTHGQVKGASTQEPLPEPKPIVQTKTEEQTIAIPYQLTQQNDATLAKGKTVVAVPGTDGVKIVSYKVTYTDGVETSRALSSERITKQPITEVIKVGTKVAVAVPKPTPTPPPASTPSNCSPNYSGCVPIASDVDCAGGSGNGPAYVSGPLNVLGADIYGLDADHDGLACE